MSAAKKTARKVPPAPVSEVRAVRRLPPEESKFLMDLLDRLYEASESMMKIIKTRQMDARLDLEEAGRVWVQIELARDEVIGRLPPVNDE